MDVAAPNPHGSVPHTGDSLAEFNFVAVIRQIAIKSFQAFPQGATYEKGAATDPR